jgi:hypothetical protein
VTSPSTPSLDQSLLGRALVDIDPRDYVSNPQDISDEAVEIWRRDGVCLCGCGAPVSIRRRTEAAAAPGRRIPAFTRSFYLRGHSQRLPAARAQVRRLGEMAPAQHKRKWVAKYREDRGRMPSRQLAETIAEWLAHHPGEDYRTLAASVGLSTSIMYGIKSGRRPFVDPETFARLLEAMGEADALRPELRERLEDYRRRRAAASRNGELAEAV